jgi:hypothetical protein
MKIALIKNLNGTFTPGLRLRKAKKIKKVNSFYEFDFET